MAEVLLFHHAHGLTAGVTAFAERFREAGHTVHTPDLYDGNVFERLEDGVAYANRVGFGEIMERGRAAADSLPAEITYAGFSLGVMPAQMLAQTRAGAKGALLLSACITHTEFSAAWPDGVPVQIHGMDSDPYFAGEGDVDAARKLVTTAGAELFLYPGDKHLFADPSLPDYDPEASALLTNRALQFLAYVR